MALPSSGPLSAYDINIELGVSGTTQRGMNDSVVRTLFGLASGQIDFATGRGKSNRVAINLTISSATPKINIKTLATPLYVAGKSDVVLTINPGTVVYSDTTGQYALDTGTGWAPGDTIKVVNNGYIIGMYGVGGQTGSNGGAGGPALRAQYATTITNNGIIAGGGGGGGGGGQNTYCGSVSGGNGAGGNSVSGYSAQYYFYDACNDFGYQLGYVAPGQNGANREASCSYWAASIGGPGGGWGGSGGAGSTNTCEPNASGGAGGAGGSSVSGNSNITWLATGQRYGAIN